MPTYADLPLHLYQVLEEEFMSLHGPIPNDKDYWVEVPDSKIEGKFWWVNARLDWFFHEGHVRNLKVFADRLIAAATVEGAQADPLSAYIRSRLGEPLLTQLKEYDPPHHDDDDDDDDASSVPSSPPSPPETVEFYTPRTGSTVGEALLLCELNELLKDKNLYSAEHFKKVELSDASEGLARQRFSFKSWQSSGAGASSASAAASASSSPPSSPPCSPPYSGPTADDEDLVHLNRLLLQDGYPEAFETIGNTRLAAIYSRLHRQKQTALSLSGGGIRSGTFALGLLQGLARHKLLEKFDYLSTVSGGGYIGSWLTAWLHRHPDGLKGVSKDLANLHPEAKVDPDPPPLAYLRANSNFITPKVGLLTADTWAFIGIYLRNLLLNWAALIPIFAAALLIPRLAVAAVLGQPPNQTDPINAIFGIGGLSIFPRHLLLILGVPLIILALVYIGFNRPSAAHRLGESHPSLRKLTNQKWFLLLCLLPLVCGAVCLTTYSAWSLQAKDGNIQIWPYLVFGAVVTLTGWFIYTVVILHRFSWSEVRFGELFALLGAGLLGGLLFWKLADTNFGNPTGMTSIYATWITWQTELYVCFALPLFLLVFMLAVTFYVGFSSHSRGVRDEDREWLARLNAWMLIVIIAWCAFSCLVIFGPVALLMSPKIIASLGGVSGLISILVGRSAVTSANEKGQQKTGVMSLILGNLLTILSLVFLAFFVAVLSLLTSLLIQWLFSKDLIQWLFSGNLKLWNVVVGTANAYRHEEMQSLTKMAAHMRAVHYPSFGFFLLLLVGLAALGVLMARFINLNLFSLHGGYRNRLIRGFLGASRNKGERKPNPFTGFDPADNISMHELRPALLHESDFNYEGGSFLVNIGKLITHLKPPPAPDAKEQPNPPAPSSSSSSAAMSAFIYDNLQNTKPGVDSFTPGATPSPTLCRELLEDLNRILEKESLYEHPSLDKFKRSAKAARAEAELRRIKGSSLRSEYHVLLNRLMMDNAYAVDKIIKPCPNPPPPFKLFHVISTALNLVGGENLAWQQRKAEPFSISALHSGCFRLGYRKSRNYGGDDGISIGTAAAISGAAASSNMGYYTSSPAVSLLLTLFNVRLGWWLGNPGMPGNNWYLGFDNSERKVYRRASPTFSLLPVLQEAFGLTDDKTEYVYLTDGGHFENLALYEMVLRRCHIIVASDAAEDAAYRFGDLGNAVRKIRIDLGVPIDFSKVLIDPTLTDGTGLYWAVGKIRYSCVDKGAEDGVLIYIKPTVYARHEPRDVLEYKKNNDAFPHESTADQFFDEPQFESYRMLGSFIMDQIAGEKCERGVCRVTDIAALARAAYDKSKKSDPALDDLGLPDWLTSDSATRDDDNDGRV